MINYHEPRDVTEVPRGIIAHGVNCQHAMGSGVALAIRKKWPIVYEHYMTGPQGLKALGRCVLINVDGSVREDLFVANCYTQLNYGKDGAIYADRSAIRLSLSEVYRWADYYHLNVFMPKIGCGLGGLDWEHDVLPIIEELDNKYESVSTTVCSI